MPRKTNKTTYRPMLAQAKKAQKLKKKQEEVSEEEYSSSEESDSSSSEEEVMPTRKIKVQEPVENEAELKEEPTSPGSSAVEVEENASEAEEESEDDGEDSSALLTKSLEDIQAQLTPETKKVEVQPSVLSKQPEKTPKLETTENEVLSKVVKTEKASHPKGSERKMFEGTPVYFRHYHEGTKLPLNSNVIVKQKGEDGKEAMVHPSSILVVNRILTVAYIYDKSNGMVRYGATMWRNSGRKNDLWNRKSACHTAEERMRKTPVTAVLRPNMRGYEIRKKLRKCVTVMGVKACKEVKVGKEQLSRWQSWNVFTGQTLSDAYAHARYAMAQFRKTASQHPQVSLRVGRVGYMEREKVWAYEIKQTLLPVQQS